jgi:hypothetical protein
MLRRVLLLTVARAGAGALASHHMRVKSDDTDDGSGGAPPPQWHPVPHSVQGPRFVTPLGLRICDLTECMGSLLPFENVGFSVQFVLLPNGATAMLHLCGAWCPGWPARGLLQSLSTDHGTTFGRFSLVATLPPTPPACQHPSIMNRSGGCGFSTPQLAASADRRSWTAVLHAYPYADMFLTAVWDDAASKLDFNLSSIAPAFLGIGLGGGRTVDSGRIGPIVRLASGRTLFSFEWDNFSQPQASPKHANITICYTDDHQHWRLSDTQAPVGHPMINGEARCDGANEPTSVMLSNGTLLTFIRTQTGRLWRTLSDDNGTHLQPAVPTQYVSPPACPNPPLLVGCTNTVASCYCLLLVVDGC